MEFAFRSATFGGFNRQDVTAYLEQSAKEWAQKEEGLQAQIKAEQEARQVLEEKITTLEGEREGCNQRLAAQSEKTALLEKAQSRGTEELARTTRELEQKIIQLTAQEAEMVALRSQISMLEPAAKNYECLKERTATIELEAHQCAQATMATAQEQSQEVHSQVEAWLRQTQVSYDRLQKEITGTLATVNADLDRVQNIMGHVTDTFAQQSDGLKSIASAYREVVAPPAPTPIPLED